MLHSARQIGLPLSQNNAAQAQTLLLIHLFNHVTSEQQSSRSVVVSTRILRQKLAVCPVIIGSVARPSQVHLLRDGFIWRFNVSPSSTGNRSPSTPGDVRKSREADRGWKRGNAWRRVGGLRGSRAFTKMLSQTERFGTAIVKALTRRNCA